MIMIKLLSGFKPTISMSVDEQPTMLATVCRRESILVNVSMSAKTCKCTLGLSKTIDCLKLSSVMDIKRRCIS